MTAPAPAICTDCNTRPVAKRLHTPVLGSQPVVLSLCNCDYLTCRNCTRSIRNIYAKVCDCGARI